MSSRLARSRARRRRRRARARIIALGVTVAAGGGFAVAGSLLHAAAGPPATASPRQTTTPAAVEAVVETTVRSETKAASAASAAKASGPSKFTDEKATAYFRDRWKDGTAKRVRDIRTTGRYLRIYTNLPESAGDSKAAITLCERGLEYLAEQGERDPVVFVQAKHGENGNPVLANILGPDDDDCRVTHPKPR
ncbi:hypothetical protein ACQP1K_09610 [Sphaerimonospora sp. CA-214678]|uniref:hypothetical protein n=1 Tax=Sphaerimonospora sp. CA-214678 TaxID=3240029 RepID=UPI003D8F00C7